MLTAAVRESQKDVSGTVRLKLYKGNVTVCGRKSPNSLYSENLATFEEDSVYDQSDATGFIKLNSLRLSVKKLLEGKVAPFEDENGSIRLRSSPAADRPVSALSKAQFLPASGGR